MDQPLREKTLVARRFARSTSTYDGAAIVQRVMARRLVELVQKAVANGPLDRVLELGCGTGLLTDLLVARFAMRQLVLNDIVPSLAQVATRCRRIRPGLQVEVCPGDMESVPLPDQQDLVVSSAVLQWANDPHAMLGKMLDAVKRRGLIAIATFGPHNLRETRDLTGHSLPYLSLDQIRAILAPNADVLECQEETRSISFDSAFAMLQHLKQTGVNGVRQTTWSPRVVKDFCRSYESRYQGSSGVPLTYHPMIVVARLQ